MKISLFFIIFLLFFSCKKQHNIDSDHNIDFYFNKAIICRDSKSPDSAFYYYNLAKNEYLKINDSVNTARSLVNMAIIQTQKGDFYGGIETSLEANKFLKQEKDSISRRVLASNYNNMAIASHFLKNYEDALNYYFKTIKYANDSLNKNVYYNNIGDLLITLKKFKVAKQYLEKAILTKDSLLYSRVLNNLAKAKYLDNKAYDPLPELYKSLKIRKLIKDDWGENSSYETLSEYFLDKDRNQSLFFAKEMLKAATHNKSSDDQILALQKIITLDTKNYLTNFQKFNIINDSVQTARNKAKKQFAVVRYDLEGKRAENETLKADSLKKNFGLLTLSILLVSGGFWYRKRKKRLEQEKELEVKNTQLKMSKKVHDVVANGLYHMMIDVQNNQEMDKTRILNGIEKMYEESRDIAHDNFVEKDFSLRFSNMISSYSSPNQKVLIVGYKEDVWAKISQNIQLELYYIIRELLINMKKHSHAKLVSLKFEKNDNSLKIKYIDNGTGIKDLKKQKGAGIHNMENRIDTIGGDITFEQNPKGGLIINIIIPINSKYV